jgi:hypothetical protein
VKRFRKGAEKNGTALFFLSKLEQEFFARLISPSIRLPLKLREVDTPVVIDTNSFPDEKALLFLETLSPCEGDTTAAVDDPVPGKAVLLGGGMENPDNLAGGPVVSGEGGDLGVAGHFPAGNRPDHVFDPVLEFHVRSSR